MCVENGDWERVQTRCIKINFCGFNVYHLHATHHSTSMWIINIPFWRHRMKCDQTKKNTENYRLPWLANFNKTALHSKQIQKKMTTKKTYEKLHNHWILTVFDQSNGRFFTLSLYGYIYLDFFKWNNIKITIKWSDTRWERRALFFSSRHVRKCEMILNWIEFGGFLLCLLGWLVGRF